MFEYDIDKIMDSWKHEDELEQLMDSSWKIDELRFLTTMSADEQRNWYGNMLKTYDTEVEFLFPDLCEKVTNVVEKALLVKEYRKLKKQMKKTKGA